MLHFLYSANSTFFFIFIRTTYFILYRPHPALHFNADTFIYNTNYVRSGQFNNRQSMQKNKKVTCFCIILTLNSLVMRNYALWNIKCFVEADHFTWETKNHIMIDFYIVWFSLCPLNVLSTLVKSLLMKTVYNVTDKRSFIW